MNRGFAFYFKNAMKSSAATIWKNKSLILVMAYFLSELVARLTIIFSAVFDLADIRQAKIVEENERFDIPQTLRVATKSKPVWTMVLSIIAEAFIFLGGALIIAAITAALALIGYAVWWLLNTPVYIIWLFCIPGGILLLVYTVIMVLIFSPTPYIIETNPNVGVYETVKICFDSMKGKGKTTAFFNFFIPTLLELIIIGICLGGAYAIKLFVPLVYMPVALAGWGIISLVLILLLVPMFDLAKKIAQKNLFADIVLDPANANKRTAGINIKMCTGAKFERSEINGNLVALFDETQSDSIPAPDSPARKKIRENAEKAAKNREVKKEEAKPQPQKKEEAQPPEQQPKAEPQQPVEPEKPSQPVETEPVEPKEPEPTPSVHEQLGEEQPGQSAGGEAEEFDLDKFIPEKFDFDKFIDAQVAESQAISSLEPPAESEPQPSAEPGEEPAAAKPKRKRTVKTNTEDGTAEEKPKRTRTAKPRSEEGTEEKPKRTRTPRNQTSD